MTDNIVARLRGLPLLEQGALCAEAAEKIERLRAALRLWLLYNASTTGGNAKMMVLNYEDALRATHEALEGEKAND